MKKIAILFLLCVSSFLFVSVQDESTTEVPTEATEIVETFAPTEVTKVMETVEPTEPIEVTVPTEPMEQTTEPTVPVYRPVEPVRTPIELPPVWTPPKL